MAYIDDFLNEEEKRMHEQLHDWCDCNGSWCHEGCPFYTDETEKDPSKMHWCHVDYVETSTDKPHPVFIEALHRDYDYLMTMTGKKPCIGEGKAVESVNTPVNHPEHYNQGGIECIDAMVSAFGKEAVAHFCIVNTFKYIWRASDKNGIEDIDKSIWYLNKYKELTADE